MKDKLDYARHAADLELSCAEVAHIIQAADTSWQRLVQARLALSALAQIPELAAFACGSLGRFEAGNASDLDLAIIYDSKQLEQSRTTSASALETVAAEIKRTLRALGFDISEKGLFCKLINLHELLKYIGGDEENNRHLTYRALLLTEGQWLYNSAGASAMKERLFGAYRDSEQTRGKFLTSLSNDLHRYYRTLCVDYRWKVEATEKPWAIRNLKLRHSRKLWHFANVMLQCVSALEPDASRDQLLEGCLSRPPLARLVELFKLVNRHSHFVPLAAMQKIYRSYDFFLAKISREEVRRELDGLKHAQRNDNATFIALRDNAQELAQAIEQVTEGLWQSPQMREHMVRYCLL